MSAETLDWTLQKIDYLASPASVMGELYECKAGGTCSISQGSAFFMIAGPRTDQRGLIKVPVPPNERYVQFSRSMLMFWSSASY